MKKVLVLIASFLVFLAAATVAQASGESKCQTIYGGGQSCPENVSFTLNKLIRSLDNKEVFVENLTLKDPTLNLGQEVMFQIKVKNTGDKKIDRIDLVDTLPENLTFSAGAGTYNASDRTVKITIENLEKGKEATYFISTKVVNATSAQCPVNKVTATSNTGAQASDTAGFCLPIKVVKIEPKPELKTIPSTGPESVILFSLPALGAAGFYLRKKSGL